MPLIVFGDAMFGKQNNVYKGHRSAVVNRCWQMLKRRECRGDLVAIKIDEYLSSQKSNRKGSCKWSYPPHHLSLPKLPGDVESGCHGRPAEFARLFQTTQSPQRTRVRLNETF
ncbi:hypothetical protein BDF19DRAFT_422178 [Syncephalis fuscata]|nr:hypothetical protein BDF19DRAFT_422178 [Syncephalis fuscata]